ncbi:GxxExxY protein [Pelotalea chapellei]|uniref:GxxExxY protein n=1 Tax=Pelotalea chapellei TaxID=44671 RepID=A0ABS5U6L0_9BACT|nr:GxxExxY protein [Pelotalea chapellei]MBT1071297.1 GxxExxY protein [Pelotalea chapellei]
MLQKELTDIIIGAFYTVYNTLGYGFLEKNYENALLIELRKQGLNVEQQKPLAVHYEGIVVGEYFADIVVNNSVIIELKAAEAVRKEHAAQLTNYLKATGIEVGLLFNFGPSAEFKRVIFTQNKICENPLNPSNPRSIASKVFPT